MEERSCPASLSPAQLVASLQVLAKQVTLDVTLLTRDGLRAELQSPTRFAGVIAQDFIHTYVDVKTKGFNAVFADAQVLAKHVVQEAVFVKASHLPSRAA